MDSPVAKITLARPFVRYKSSIVFWVIDVEDIPFNSARKDILWIEGIVSQFFEYFSILRKEGRTLVAFKKESPLFSPFQDLLLLGYNFLLALCPSR